MINLYDIKDPSFLKTLNHKELKELSLRIREFLIEKISITGGHLSSNLGIVELTIAMHRVFDSPKDKFIFDVGHQSYVHKILTGRVNEFDTLRQYKGLSGFIKRSESEHDVWEAGHASTSIAAAIGFDIDSIEGKNIAVIGDGSIGGGLAFEALNYISHKKDIAPIVILNDNEQSISQNIGALQSQLTQLRINKSYNLFKKIISALTPGFIKNLVKNSKRAVKSFVNHNLFEGFGINYVGPIDGHNTKKLTKYLNYAKNSKSPIIIHIITKKGKGYKFAEEDITGKWHGISSFDVETGSVKANNNKLTVSWSKAIADNVLKKMDCNPNVYVITPAMINGSKLSDIESKYPNRLLDVGIAESFATTLSAGLALNNKTVFLSIYSTFLQRAYDQIIHDLSRQNIKIIIGVDRSGLVGADGDTHQGIYDIPLLNHIPNIIITMPHNLSELDQLVNFAFDYPGNTPIAIRYPRGTTNVSKTNINEISLGSWTKLRDGKEAIVISYGSSLDMIIDDVCNEIDCTVINARFIKPLDYNMLDKLYEQKLPILIYEESIRIGGLGQQITDYYVSSNKIPSKLKVMAIEDKFVEHGSVDKLLEQLELDSKSIVNCLKGLI